MKFGIIASQNGRRETFPILNADTESDARADFEYLHPGWKIETIETNPFWWNNCLYNGHAVGHSHGFCTADSCY
jgi:hypothetical protein